MSPPPTDRETWDDATKWIQSPENKGYVHPALTFSTSRRVLRTTSSIPKGELLMRIPSSCTVTLQTAERSAHFGPARFLAVSGVKGLYHDKNDVLLALYLASLKDSPDDRFAPYLSTLPKNDGYDNLPRRWPEKQSRRLLAGTSALDRILNEKSGVTGDYGLVSKEWKEGVPFPSLAEFDRMLAAVTSRGFQELGSDGLDAMVPLLDLLDHKRGTGGMRDVSYRKSEEDGAVLVTAFRDLAVDASLCDTYGAKGNALLLVRYGFCLEGNVEPDGSSNDVLEFLAKEPHPPVELRAGPKAYSYTGFVRALELFHTRQPHDCDSRQESDNGYESEDEWIDQDEDACLYGYGDDEQEYEQGEAYDDQPMDLDCHLKSHDKHAAITAECQALDAFAVALDRAKKLYPPRITAKPGHITDTASDPARFASILINSEIRTIHFFLRTCNLIQAQLSDDSRPHTVESPTPDSSEDQILALVDAFLKIRHPLKLSRNAGVLPMG